MVGAALPGRFERRKRPECPGGLGRQGREETGCSDCLAVGQSSPEGLRVGEELLGDQRFDSGEGAAGAEPRQVPNAPRADVGRRALNGPRVTSLIDVGLRSIEGTTRQISVCYGGSNRMFRFLGSAPCSGASRGLAAIGKLAGFQCARGSTSLWCGAEWACHRRAPREQPGPPRNRYEVAGRLVRHAAVGRGAAGARLPERQFQDCEPS